MATTGYIFDENGVMTGAPMLWDVDKLPYRHDWDRWREHVAVCAQCAHHTDEKAAPVGVSTTPPCAVGSQMVYDYQDTVRWQASEARWN